MALARNLNRQQKRSKFRWPKIEKRIWVVLIVIGIIGLAYGAVSLWPHVSFNGKKEEIKFETGDRPLPQTTSIWVNADGGLKMREKPDIKSKLIYLIPNGIQLTATQTSGDWYKVNYMNKDGWVNKNYVTTQAPAEDPTKGWKTYANSQAGYTLRYPKDWVAQDYGANPATNSTSYVAFGPQLPAQLDPSILPPIMVRLSSQTAQQVESSYTQNQGAVSEAATISGLSGKKITYNSSSGTQMTVYFVSKGSLVYILEETGGYADELSKIVAGLNLS